MFDTDKEVRKAKAKHETITASHSWDDWDDYYLTDELDDEHEIADRFEYDMDELREVNKANIDSLKQVANIKK